jgi:exonuclease SbcC
MRPLELALEGFTSFRTEQRIDFTPLDLFAIIGPTGAGKSSILDAMTFALYGLTMRTGKQASELVSQGASVLKVQFRFVVRATEYRVTRTWRYRPSTPEIKIQLERLDPEDWNTLATGAATVQKLIESIVGMDFDTFTRVILLPQGKFDEFLKGDAPKRRELLRQLAGLEIYERMRKEAGERARANKAEREAAERQLTLLEVPTPDEAFQKREQLSAVENAMPGLNAEATAAEALLADEERLFQAVARLAELKTSLSALTAKDVEVDVLAERLARAQRADRLKGDFAALSAARTQQQTAQSTLAAAGRRRDAAQAALAEQQASLAAAKAKEAEQAPALQARENALSAAKAYEEQRVRAHEDATAAQHAASAQTQTHARAEAAFKQAETQFATAKAALETIERELGGLKPGGDRLASLTAAARPLSQWGTLKKQAIAALRKLVEATTKREAATAYVAKVAERLAQVQRELAEAKTELETATAANGEAALHDHARLLRAGLKPGEACLACGGDFDPAHAPALAPSTLIDLAPLQALAADRLERSHKGAMVMAEAETKLEAERAREAEAKSDLTTAESELAEVTAQIDQLLGADTWDALALEAELSALTEADRRHKAALERQKAGQAAFREAEQALGFARQTLTDAQAALAAAKAESDRRAARLAEVEAQLHALTGGQPYEALSASLARDRAALQALLDQATAGHQAAHDASLQAEEAFKQATETASAAADRLSAAEEAWANALLLAGFTEGSYAEALSSPADQEAWQAAIEAHGQEKVRLATRVEELVATIGDRATDEGAIARAREAVVTVRAALDEANRALADLKAWLTVAESKQKTASDLMAQVEAFATQEQIFYTLSRDLKADEFQDYLLEFLQADLVSRATVILRELSDGRYALRMREGEFWVDDNWNGGDARRVRTLSGGETFATSLSMALALSEKLAMGSELGSLFLDEGFGTLDAETLESVTQILESLRAQNRMIGVITHVKSLGERLPTQIKVSKAPEGSRVMVESL